MVGAGGGSRLKEAMCVCVCFLDIDKTDIDGEIFRRAETCKDDKTSSRKKINNQKGSLIEN